jgi:hypothetical protein
MSATNRGTIRNESDFYITPESIIKVFLNQFKLKYENYILEPCAGNGSISKVINEYYPFSDLHQVEIRPEEINNLKSFGSYSINDFRNMTFLNWKFSTIISNPPYSIAQEIIEHAFTISNKDTEIIMLLRLGFLEAEKRRDFWNKHPLTQLYPLINRPSFTGRGTDACAYGWFVWSNQREKLIKSI